MGSTATPLRGAARPSEFHTQSCISIALEHSTTALRVAEGGHALHHALVAHVRCLFVQARDGVRKASVEGADQVRSSEIRHF
jgi:hypothetical protein